METDDERILRQRARALRLADLGQRAGYVLLLGSLIMFVFGLVVGLNDTITTIIVIDFAIGAVILGPSIILGYAAKAADRYEKTGETGH